MPSKYYLYVDESGLHTGGEHYVIGLVLVSADDRDSLWDLCIRLEQESGKGGVKWVRARRDRRTHFMRLVCGGSAFKGVLGYRVFRGRADFQTMTIEAILGLFAAGVPDDYKATVFIDGLPRRAERRIGRLLRLRGAIVSKVRGVKKDENNPLIRLRYCQMLWIASSKVAVLVGRSTSIGASVVAG